MDISDGPLISQYADDPVISPLLNAYTHNLRIDVSDIVRCINEGRWEKTCKFAHQLRGSTVSYGYPELADIFFKLEVEAEKHVVDIALVNSLIKEVQNLSKRVN